MLKVVNILLYVFYMLFLFFFATIKQTKNSKRILQVFTLLMMGFFFIKEIGLDYEVYKNWFYELNLSTKYKLFGEHMEPIPYFLMYYLRKLGLSHRYFFFIIGSIPLLVNYYIIKNNKKNKVFILFSLFLFLFFPSFTGAVRQNLAAALFLLALYLYCKKRKIKSLFFVLLSFFSHYSTIFCIPIFFLKKLKIKWNIRKYFSTIIVIITVSLFLRIIINVTTQLDRSNILLWKLKYYLFYSNVYEYINNLHQILAIILGKFPILGTIILNFIFINKKNKFDVFKENILEISIVSSLVAVLFLFLGSEVIANRIMLTFSYGLYFLLEDSSITKTEKNFIIVYFIFYNFINLLYYAGVHSPASPFYLL